MLCGKLEWLLHGQGEQLLYVPLHGQAGGPGVESVKVTSLPCSTDLQKLAAPSVCLPNNTYSFHQRLSIPSTPYRHPISSSCQTNSTTRLLCPSQVLGWLWR